VYLEAGDALSWAGDQDGGRGASPLVGDQVEQGPQSRGFLGGGVDQQHPAGPHVVIDLAGATGGDVGGVGGGAVDHGHRIRHDLGGRRVPGRARCVVADPLVQPSRFAGEADAVDPGRT
jgi:hypothetical protein